MDNDNKVSLPSSKRHDEVLLFLNEELNGLQGNNNIQTYNLDEEFAKTKKNRNTSITVILLSAFVGVFLLAVSINAILAKKNSEITIAVDSFSDLNLKSLIDSVSSAQTNYENAVRTKTRLEAQLEADLRTAQTEKENEIFILDSLKLRSKADYNARLSKIEQEYNSAVLEIHKKYDGEILAAEKEAEVFQDQLKQFDAAKVEAAQEQQKILASERELRLLEQRRITEKYEAQIAELERKIEDLNSKNASEMQNALKEVVARYQEEIDALDPVIRNSRGDAIITSLADDYDVYFKVSKYIEENSIDNPIVNENLAAVENFAEDYVYLENTMKALPYKNSMVSYLKGSRKLVNKMSRTFADNTVKLCNQNKELENINLQLQAQIENQEKQIQDIETQRINDNIQLQNSYSQTFDGLLTLAKAQAVILSATSADNIKVYVGLSFRDQIPEEGLNAEIRSVKVLKGKVIPSDEGFYYFIPALDKLGNPVEVDLEMLLPGTVVRVSR